MNAVGSSMIAVFTPITFGARVQQRAGCDINSKQKRRR
jgi:hypothetical protein